MPDRIPPAGGEGAPHNILSPTHPDTIEASVLRGDIVIGDPTGKWARLALGLVNRVLKSDGIDINWGQVAHNELSGVTSDQHHPQAHTLASHTTKAHSELTDILPDDHHSQAHTLTSHSTKAHSELTDIGADNHHPQAHTLASHTTKAHSELTDVLSDQHHARSHDHSLIADGSPIAVAGVPNLPASKITSERFPMGRMPDGTLNYVLKAQGLGFDPLYGQVGHGELTGITEDQHHARSHDHSLAADGSPIAVAGVPNLPASKITSGILDYARGGLGKPLSPTWINDYLLVYKTATDNFVMEAKPAAGGARLVGTVSVDPPSIAKTTTVNVDVTVTGLLTTDKVWVQCQSDLEHGLICIAAYCPSNNTLRLRITNWSSAAIDGASRTWAYQAYA